MVVVNVILFYKGSVDKCLPCLPACERRRRSYHEGKGVAFALQFLKSDRLELDNENETLNIYKCGPVNDTLDIDVGDKNAEATAAAAPHL